MRMREACQRLRLLQKRLGIRLGEVHVQHFQRGVAPQRDMLAQVDFSEAPLPQQANQTIVAQLLTDTICHHSSSGASIGASS